MNHTITVSVLALFPAFPLVAPAQQPGSESPRAVVIGNAQADFYPFAFGNVLGLDSTLFVTSLAGGNFEVVTRGINGEIRSFPMQIPTGTIRQIGMQDIGIADGPGIIVVRAADEQTTGVSVLVVQSQAGGVDVVDPFPFNPAVLDQTETDNAISPDTAP